MGKGVALRKQTFEQKGFMKTMMTVLVLEKCWANWMESGSPRPLEGCPCSEPSTAAYSSAVALAGCPCCSVVSSSAQQCSPSLPGGLPAFWQARDHAVEKADWWKGTPPLEL